MRTWMKENYETTDIVLAAYLRLNNCSLIHINKIGQQGTFVFSSVPEELITNYQLGNGKVEPRLFNNMVRQLSTSVRNI